MTSFPVTADNGNGTPSFVNEKIKRAVSMSCVLNCIAVFMFVFVLLVTSNASGALLCITAKPP